MYMLSLAVFFLVLRTSVQKETDCQSGGRQIMELVKHNVQCDKGEGITAWKVETCPAGMKFVYNCELISPPTSDTVTASTECQEVDKNLEQLNLFPVRCPQNSVMQGFRMSRERGRDLGLIKSTCALVDTSTCRSLHTNCQETNRQGNVYLDRRDVSCGDDEFLTYWRQVRDSCHEDYRRTRYNCCKVVPDCTASATKGQWEFFTVVTDAMEVTYTEGTSFTEDREVTEEWSASVVQTIETSLTVKVGTEGTEITVTASDSLEVIESGSIMITNSITTDTSQSLQWQVSQPGVVWQFAYHVEDPCGGATIKTAGLAFTANRGETPCCLPGWNVDPTNAHSPCVSGSPCLCDDESLCFPSKHPSAVPSAGPSAVPTSADPTSAVPTSEVPTSAVPTVLPTALPSVVPAEPPSGANVTNKTSSKSSSSKSSSSKLCTSMGITDVIIPLLVVALFVG